MGKMLEIKTKNPGWGDRTTPNFAFPAGGIRRPHRLRFAPAVRERVVVSRHDPPREVSRILCSDSEMETVTV